jgi:hypothetical protein
LAHLLACAREKILFSSDQELGMVDVERLNELIDKKAVEKEQKKQQFLRDLPYRIRFKKGIEKMSSYGSSGTIDSMVDMLRQYLDRGNTEEDAIMAVMLWAADKCYVYDKAKIAKATQIVLDYNPWFRAKILANNKYHPILTHMFLASLAVVAFLAIQMIIIYIDAGVFATIYFSFVGMIGYVWFTMGNLLIEP